MKLAIFCLLLVGCHALPAELEKDNKAVESKTVKSVTPSKETEKSNKQEKRAPVVMTAVPGELKYGNKIEYAPELKYTHQLIQSAPEVKYVSPDPKSPFYEPPQAAPKPQYVFYTPQSAAPAPTMAFPAQAQLILMLAVPHPSGQYMMLYPAQNLLFPMYYRSPINHQASASGSVPVPGYQAPSVVPAPYHSSAATYQPTYSAPPQHQLAGFVAQHQLAYTGSYRSDKYAPAKQQ